MKILLISIAILLVIILVFIVYLGAFKKLTISIKKAGGEIAVYESITGNYKQSGRVMDKIYYSLLNDDKIETYKGFGVYYDNPKKVEESKLRSEAGCILESADSVLIDKLSKKHQIKTIDTKEYIVTEFPYKNKLSVIFSIIKVYPALQKYALENNFAEDSPVIEIYDIPNKKILYRKEIVN